MQKSNKILILLLNKYIKCLKIYNIHGIKLKKKKGQFFFILRYEIHIHGYDYSKFVRNTTERI